MLGVPADGGEVQRGLPALVPLVHLVLLLGRAAARHRLLHGGHLGRVAGRRVWRAGTQTGEDESPRSLSNHTVMHAGFSLGLAQVIWHQFKGATLHHQMRAISSHLAISHYEPFQIVM